MQAREIKNMQVSLCRAFPWIATVISTQLLMNRCSKDYLFLLFSWHCFFSFIQPPKIACIGEASHKISSQKQHFLAYPLAYLIYEYSIYSSTSPRNPVVCVSRKYYHKKNDKGGVKALEEQRSCGIVLVSFVYIVVGLL